jgi:myo-inositol-1(or 4)-monophosphatase
VYEINRNECFTAVKGKGAYLNNNPIKVSDNKKLKDSLIATGFPIYNFSKLDGYLNALKHLMQNTHGIRRIGAAAADLCYLACGRVDGFFEYNLSPWDVAAGALIVEEAGGTITDFKDGDNWLYGKEIIGSNNSIKDELNDVVIGNLM